MKFTGDYVFQNKIDEVWDKLNDPEVLKESIHGCKDFLEKEKNKFSLKIHIKIGPINANFLGDLEIKEIKPLNSYTIEANATAGQLGGASGKVRINLVRQKQNTQLIYDANAKINGKIAQLGARLIEGTVKKNTILFFNNFERMLNKHEMKPKVNENKLQEVESQEKKDNFKRKYVYLVVLFFLALSIYIANNE